MDEDRARGVMLTAHQKGSCVVSVLPRDVAESQAIAATDAARERGFPLLFTTDSEE